MRNNTYKIIGDEDLQKKLLQLKSFGQQLSESDIEELSVEMFLVNIDTKKRKERIKEIKKLGIAQNLQEELRKNILKAIDSRSEISALLDTNIESNEHFYYEQQFSTDFEQVEKKINSCSSSITKSKDIHNFNAYIVRITIGRTSEREEITLSAVTYFASGWKVSCIPSFCWDDTEANIKPYKPEFKIYNYVSFFSMEDGLFISNINHFQTIMNYEERLKEKKIETANALEEHNIISEDGKETLLNIIGNDKTMMKQLASTQRLSHYKKATFSERLYQKIHLEGFGQLEFDDNNVIVVKNDKAYVKEMLTLLQDKRVITLIFENLADVDGNLSQLIPESTS